MSSGTISLPPALPMIALGSALPLFCRPPAHRPRALARQASIRLALVPGAMAIWLSVWSPVWAASPRLTTILPRGVQRGTQQVLTFVGSRLADGQQILFYEDGFDVAKIEADGDSRLKVLVTVAPDCRLGEHVAQVRTASGISDYRTLYVGALPEVDEKEPNSDFAAPQPIDLNVTVRGVIKSEDVDCFAVEAQKGQRISAEVEGMRLGGTLFDPYLSITDSKRFELAVADDTPLVMQDCVAQIVAPQPGRYVIAVRDSAYGGNDQCHYRLHIGTFPRPTAAYPPGGKMGAQEKIRFLGDAAGGWDQTITLPSVLERNFGLLATDAQGSAPSPIPFRLYEHGNALEKEPNNTPARATPVQLPLAFCGIISDPGDTDYFTFDAKKGQVFDVQCYARRVRSPLDPVMNLIDASGKSLVGNDDTQGPDSYFRFTVPADGQLMVRVTDHLGRGGEDFVYRVELQPVRPELTLGIPRAQRNSQYRQSIFVARGNRFGTLISATRTDFGGDLVLEAIDLPPGVTIDAEPMPANLNVMPVVFSATADAPIGGKLVDLSARHADPNTKIKGGFQNRADLVIAAPNQSVYRWCDVHRLAVAVVEQLPFRLQLVEPKVPLVRNGSMQLQVVAHRNEGFTAPIQVLLPFRPPGVGATSSVTIPEGKNEVVYPINAAAGAQLRKWKVFAIGSAEAGGTAWSSSQLVELEVADPYVTLTMERAACEQGQPVQIYGKVDHHKPLAGPAKAQLLGLPPKVTAPELELTTETKELVFDVKTDKTSPAGKYRNVFCQVTITVGGAPIVSRAGSTELQIDKPLPAAAAAAAPAVVAKAPPPPPGQPKPKPLSRLQKLRLEARRQAAARTDPDAAGS